MLKLDSFTIAQLQNFRSMLSAVKMAGITDIAAVDALIEQQLSGYSTVVTSTAPRRSDNVTACTVCGGPAVMVPLNRADRTASATHAIQCQNRPSTDHPWRDGMCGHTEYVVRSER